MSDTLAVVFPRADLRGGVERVAWELLHYLADRQPTEFVGAHLEPRGGREFRHRVVRPSRAPRAVRPLAFRRAAVRALSQDPPRRTVTFGVECPAGDVLWVQSVHRAWLAQSGAVAVRGLTVPARMRSALPRHRILLELERRYFTRSQPEWILCTSPREAEDLQRFYAVDPRRTVVIPNGFDGGRFNPERRLASRERERARLGIADDEVALLFVANELHRKGFRQTLEALAASRNRRLELHLVGRMPPAAYRERIRALGLQDRVHYHGPSSEVERYYAAADAFVLPTQYEPFGLVIIEAMACGLPVIASSRAGASAAIAHGVSGLTLEDPSDVAELTGLLTEVCSPDRRAALGAAAAEAAMPYEWQRVFRLAEPYLLGS